MSANNPHMLWKRLAPLVLAAALTAMVSAAASLSGPLRDCEPRFPFKTAVRAL